MTIGVVIAAAGRGSRLGEARPKALLTLGGQSLLERAVRAFLDRPDVGPIVAAVPDPLEAAAVLGAASRRVRLVPGGATRQASVRAALGFLSGVDLVLVHDAARPLVPKALIDAVAAAAGRSGAAAPGLPIPDTVKRLGPQGRIAGTVPREGLLAIQTPQGFRLELLQRAHAEALRAGFEGTDDAALVERLGHEIEVVPGSRVNFKITTPEDLRLAEAILASMESGREEPGA